MYILHMRVYYKERIINDILNLYSFILCKYCFNIYILFIKFYFLNLVIQFLYFCQEILNK